MKSIINLDPNKPGLTKNFRWYSRKLLLLPAFLLLGVHPLHATKLVVVKVVDKDYLMISFKDGDVEFVDDAQGQYAYTSAHQTDNNYVVSYGNPLNIANATNKINWIIKSADDPQYAAEGANPVNCFRKSKLNGLAEMDWNSAENDWNYEYTMEHHIFLELPHSLVQGKSYTLEINSNINSDISSESFSFDIFSSRTEAIHTNLVGYSVKNSIKAADLYMWLGDGGARDYSDFEGNEVYIYDVNSGKSYTVGNVNFYRAKAGEASGHMLIQSDVWTADFTNFNAPGTYRLAIEGIGCSEEFHIAGDIYSEPFRVSTLGYFYMRIGQDNPEMTPVPRKPLYIPGVSPANTKVIISDFSPYHPEWDNYSGDNWDNPGAFSNYIKAGSPENPNAYGGWSDAADWDRHLEHSINIYDMLLPYILSDGNLPADDLGIAESNNGIPDVLDEARQEVDFWLRLRYGKGYSHGVSCPSNNTLYQADNTPMAAWANAVNAAMLADAFRIAGDTGLMERYLDSALIAYNYAGSLSDQMLNTNFTAGLRGRDLKMTAAACLYNLTGNTVYEDIVQAESLVTGPTSNFIKAGEFNQLYAMAAYLKSPQSINYPDLRQNMTDAAVYQAMQKEANNSLTRPSRRSSDGDYGWFHTEQHVQRTILAHAVTDNPDDKAFLENALILEADWSLGRNSANVIQMTTATTGLDTLRSVQQAYTSGWDDGSPGVHPGHTPYMNLSDWGSGMIMSRPSWMSSKGYPEINQWPKSEAYYDVRYVYSHCEFTPAQTMRGKQALYAYLFSIGGSSGELVPVTGVSITEPTVDVEGSSEVSLSVSIQPENATNQYLLWKSENEDIVVVNHKGVVSGVSVGTAKIFVTTYEGEFTDSCVVTVSDVSVTGVSIEPSTLLLREGYSETLKAVISPANALNKNVSWNSDNPEAVSVNENGKITALGDGIANISATTEEGSFTAGCEVTVDPLPDQLVIYRDDINRMSFTWANNGTLTERNSGGYEGTDHYEFDYEIVNWWAGAGFGFNSAIDVSRFEKLAIAFNGPDDPSHYLYLTISDANEHSSGNIILPRSEKYRTYMLILDEITAGTDLDLSKITDVMIGLGGAGSGTGKFYMDDIYFTASNTDIPVEGIEVIPETLSLNGGETQQLSVLISPSDATDKSVNWSSADPLVASVNSSGVVEGLSDGNTYIRVESVDGGFSDSLEITVIIPYVEVSGVSISPVSLNLPLYESYQLSATVIPGNATNKNVSWESNHSEIASVDEEGMVTAVSIGTATIKVMTETGAYIAESEINVVKGTGISLNDGLDEILVYPNPLNSELAELKICGLSKGKIKITILDLTGRIVYKKQLDVPGTEAKINDGKMKPGLYFMKIENGVNETVIKLVVE